MKKISIITHRDMNEVNGSTARPRWQVEALQKHGFHDFQLVDKFDETKLKDVANTLVHAHQFSARLLDDQRYIIDIHGLEYEQSSNLSHEYPVYSWKKFAFMAKSSYYKKVESKLFQKAVHLICSGEDILDRVKKFQNCTLVRNSVFLNDYLPTKCPNLQIALVGPFIPGTINFDGIDIIKKVIQELTDIQFVFIGKTDESFRSRLDYSNTKFLGIVDNYNEVLRSCSVLFSPYQENARYLGSKNKFLEAAACQMPIVTTSSGAIDFRKDLLLIGDTTRELTDLIRSMKDENERHDLGRKLRVEIEQNYNADTEIQKIIKLYKEYLN